MQKQIVSLFFLLLFTAFISAPTLISMIEKSIDTSVFYSISEEENKVNETIKIFELKLLENHQTYLSLIDSENEKASTSYLKNYESFAIECFSPPPELS